MPYLLVGLLILPVGLPLKAYELHLKVHSGPLWQVGRPVWAPIVCISAAKFRSYLMKDTRALIKGSLLHAACSWQQMVKMANLWHQSCTQVVTARHRSCCLLFAQQQMVRTTVNSRLSQAFAHAPCW